MPPPSGASSRPKTLDPHHRLVEGIDDFKRLAARAKTAATQLITSGRLRNG